MCLIVEEFENRKCYVNILSVGIFTRLFSLMRNLIFGTQLFTYAEAWHVGGSETQKSCQNKIK